MYWINAFQYLHIKDYEANYIYGMIYHGPVKCWYTNGQMRTYTVREFNNGQPGRVHKIDVSADRVASIARRLRCE